MSSIKFTNVKYYTGGGKKPLRIRHNQNYTIHVYLERQKSLLTYSENQLINMLWYLTKGRIVASNTTKVIIQK